MTCVVEQLDLSVKSESMAAAIFESEGTALVAAGSVMCLRSLYVEARRKNALERFFPCIMTEGDYAVGEREKMKCTLEKAVSLSHIRRVVLYISCPDVISGIDFAGLLREIDNPREAPIRILQRGPMVKRRKSPKEEMDKILREFSRLAYVDGKTVQHADTGGSMLPVMAPDAAAVFSILQAFPVDQVLITPGGCSRCLDISEEIHKNHRMYRTSFNDIDFCTGFSEKLRSILDRKFSEDRMVCCLFTPAVRMNGTTGYLTQDSENQKVFHTDGFHYGLKAAADAFVAIGELFSEKHSLKQGGNTILVLGQYSLGTACSQYYREAQSYLTEKGYNCVLLSQLWDAEDIPEICSLWPWNLEGKCLAEIWSRRWNIPIYNELLEPAKKVFPSVKREKKLCIITEGLLSEQLKKFYEKQGISVTVGLHTPDFQIRKFYDTYLTENVFYFSDMRGFNALIEDKDVLLADEVFSEYIFDAGCEFYELPYPMAGGRLL